MVNVNEKKRILSLVMLGVVALVWGLGFVLSDELLADGFAPVPGLQNAIRFGVGTLLLVIVLWKHIKLTKQTILYGAIGGALLFGGFLLQLVGQIYITPAHCGLFTALYFVMTPFLAWIVYKHAPHYTVFIAVALAVVGLVILNMGKMPTAEETLGTILTIAGAIMFATQIVFADYLLKKNKITSNNLVVLQLVFASILFVLYTLIFESHKYPALTISIDKVWWKLAILAFLGSGFAYFAQTYAQKHISPSQTSLILACETPIGAIASIIVGIDLFSWNIVIGGILVVVAVFIIEFAPVLANKLLKRTTDRPRKK